MAADFRHHQPAITCEAILGGQQGAAAITKLVLSTISGGPHPGDTIGIGAGQQHPQHIALRHCQGKPAGLVNLGGYAAKTPRLGPGSLEPTVKLFGARQIAHQQGYGNRHINATVGHWVTLGQNRRQQTGSLCCIKITAHQQHMGQPWMQWYLGQPDSVRGELPLIGNPTKCSTASFQHSHSLGKGSSRWQVEPIQIGRVIDTPGQQLQCQWCQVSLQDFRRAMGHQTTLLLLTPQPITVAGPQAPCPSCALLGRGARNTSGA